MKSWIALPFVVLALTACGSSFQPASIDSPSESAESLAPENPNVENPWEKVELDGEVKSSLIGTHQVVEIDKINKTLRLLLPLPANPLGSGFTAPVKRLPGATFSVEPDLNGGWVAVLEVPLVYVIRGVSFLDESRLPNGRKIPAIPGGQLPSLALEFLKTKTPLTMYIGKGALGLFVPVTQIKVPVDITIPVKTKKQRKNIGYVVLVSPGSTSDGGIFVSINLPDELKKLIDPLLP